MDRHSLRRTHDWKFLKCQVQSVNAGAKSCFHDFAPISFSGKEFSKQIRQNGLTKNSFFPGVFFSHANWLERLFELTARSQSAIADIQKNLKIGYRLKKCGMEADHTAFKISEREEIKKCHHKEGSTETHTDKPQKTMEVEKSM